jgi:ankyrin repeat protein
MAETLLKHGANPNVLNGNNANALFFATTFGHTQIVKLLLQYNVNTLQVDRMGKTALDYAIGQENTEIISLLGK